MNQIRVSLLGLVLAVVTINALQASPRIDRSSLRGLKVGASNSIVLYGKELGGTDAKLLLDFEAIETRILPESTDRELKVELDLPEGSLSRFGNLRVVTKRGVSNRLTVGIDSLDQIPWTEEVKHLPVALSGQLSGSELRTTSFQGRAGQRVVIEVEAQRIDSKLRPLISVVDHRDTQISYSTRETTAKGDARVVVVLPSDGIYGVRLHDALFQGAAPGHYRLKIGDFAYADLAYPPAIQRGQQVSVRLLATSESPTLEGNDTFTSARLPLTRPTRPFTGPQPSVMITDLPELMEPEVRSAELPRLGSTPVAVSGLLRGPTESDEYMVAVSPKQRYRVEVFADRLQSPIDAVLQVRQLDGNVLANADDQNNTPDPMAVFAVPDGVEQVIVSVFDRTGSGGPSHLYRVMVTPEKYADFQLQASTETINCPVGSAQAIEVVAERKDYGGPIQLEFLNLPEGVQVQNASIPAGASRAWVSLIASQQAATTQICRLIGKAKVGDREIIREAAVGTDLPANGLTPDRSDLAIGIDRQPEVTIQFDPGKSDDGLKLGRQTLFPVVVQRGQGISGPVRLKVLTSQATPMVKGKIDASRAFTTQGNPELPPGKSEYNVPLNVPSNLKDMEWDVAIQAELLSKDKKTVLATATTKSQRYRIKSPIFLAVQGERIVRISGKLSRAGGFNEPVTVSATGLPKGVTASEVKLDGKTSDFTIELKIPENVKSEQLKKLRLVAKTKRGDQDTTSNEIELGIQVDTK